MNLDKKIVDAAAIKILAITEAVRVPLEPGLEIRDWDTCLPRVRAEARAIARWCLRNGLRWPERKGK